MSVDSFQTYVQGQVSNVINIAATAANDLTAIAEGRLSTFEFSAVPDYDPATQMVVYTPANVTMGSVAAFVKPTVPTLVNSDIPLLDAADPMVMPTMTGFDPQSFDPTTISGEITAFAARVITLMDSGGPGISDAVQTALMDNMRERDLQILDDVLLRVRASDAMSGFPFPTSISDAAEAEHRKKYQDDYSNRNREIVALMTERAHQTAMNALNAGVSLTQIKSNLQDSIWKLYYSMQGLILDEFKTLVGAEVSRVETETRKILGDYEALKTRALVEKDVKLEQFKIQSEGEEIRVRSQTTLAVSTAEVVLKSNEQLLNAAIAETKSQLDKWLTDVNQLTERGKAEIQQLLENNQRRLGAADTQAKYYAGLITSLSQMVNTIQTKEETA